MRLMEQCMINTGSRLGCRVAVNLEQPRNISAAPRAQHERQPLSRARAVRQLSLTQYEALPAQACSTGRGVRACDNPALKPPPPLPTAARLPAHRPHLRSALRLRPGSPGILQSCADKGAPAV